MEIFQRSKGLLEFASFNPKPGEILDTQEEAKYSPTWKIQISNTSILGIHKSTSRSKIPAYVFSGNLGVVTNFSEKCINVIRYQAKGPEILIYGVKISVEIQERIPYCNASDPYATFLGLAAVGV
ncbi:hypothetical protein CFP56_040837, partial [Quercus suber]